MKVLLVTNGFYMTGNGLFASARTTYKYLREAGVDVRVLSMKNADPDGPQPEFPLEKYHFPVFQPLIDKQGYSFASSDEKVLKEAIQWADVIHLEEAFVLEIRVANLARKYGVPCVATFHLHPENIFCNIGMINWKLPNNIMLDVWRKSVFDKCSHIQCPTQNVLDRLTEAGYKAKLHLIPNGAVLHQDELVSKPETDPYLVECIGRLSVEKDQYTLLNAMKFSKYADRIQLYFAGQGPEKKKLMRKAAALNMKYPPVFAFHTPRELRELSSRAYLYIHCATIEVEGLSCIEALQQGAVPIIAQSKLSATPQFALCPESLFTEKNPQELASKIDWWIEHPEKRAEMGKVYADSIHKYEIHYSIDALIKMYQQAIDDAS